MSRLIFKIVCLTSQGSQVKCLAGQEPNLETKVVPRKREQEPERKAVSNEQSVLKIALLPVHLLVSSGKVVEVKRPAMEARSVVDQQRDLTGGMFTSATKQRAANQGSGPAGRVSVARVGLSRLID